MQYKQANYPFQRDRSRSRVYYGVRSGNDKEFMTQFSKAPHFIISNASSITVHLSNFIVKPLVLKRDA